MSHWYLIFTKPRQEQCALDNLAQQGFSCYLPHFTRDKVCRGKLLRVCEPLFPRYLFVLLDSGIGGQNWAPIRSTLGVTCMVKFGNEPARVDDALIDLLRAREQLQQKQPQQLFAAGDHVTLASGAFAGVAAIFQSADGQGRALLLLDMLSKSVSMRVDMAKLTKIA